MDKPANNEETDNSQNFRELDLKKIGERFIQIRKELDKNQQQMARLLGTSQGMLSQYERGLVEPPLTIVVRIAELGGKDLGWVVIGE